MEGKEHVSDLLPAYALDILDEAETIQVSQHLADCQLCQAELQGYQQVSQQLSMAVTESQPPESLKWRLLERIQTPATQADPQDPTTQRGWLSSLSMVGLRAWAVVSLLLVAALLVSNLLLWQQISQPQVNDSLRVVNLTGEGLFSEARGIITMSVDGERGTLVVDGLRHLESKFVYQIWLFRDGEISSGGTFTVYEGGYGHARVDSDQPLANYEGLMVTIEVEGGSPTPSGAVALAGDL
ncbi:MAG: anti-sigma factor [Anaerolineales bacterium]|nr:anti-sigma factor [Anaerolineales bacterium]